MSQKVSRKGPAGDDKDKGSTDSPVKEMKKKMAANAEKEKQAAEKHAEKEKDKEKPAEKPEKAPEKADKSDKTADKKEKAEKCTDKKEKQVEKEKEKEKEKAEKSAEKKNEAPAEKPKEDKAKPDKQEPNKPSQAKPKQNGARANGLPSTPTNNTATHTTASEAHNGEHSDDGTVSSGDERDDMFPELAYDDSDGECEFEPPTPEGVPSRSHTRRSQAKVTRTPETPRPASDKRAEKDTDDSKESKVLKLKDDVPVTDRKLRSSDSPKPDAKKLEKVQEKKEKEGAKETEIGSEKEISKEVETKTEKRSPRKRDLELQETESEKRDDSAVEIVIDLDGDEERRKADTNYSRSRVKVSPYRRARLDHTASSLLANYTGNNTTMEMDITETSSLVEDASTVTESPYLSAIRNIRGRRSYKPLKEMNLRNISVNRSVRSTTSVTVTEQPTRPMAPVVGRKRKPEGEGPSDLATEVDELAVRGKRARLLDKLARPFRSVAAPMPARRNAEIVGINTDLPLTAPVATPDTFDPETLKTSPITPPPSPPSPPTPPDTDRDGKRCSIM